MGVKVQAPQARGSGIFNSPALKIGQVVGGAMSGNPSMIAGGLSKSGSPMSNAAGMYDSISAMGRKFGPQAGVGGGSPWSLGVDTQLPKFDAPDLSVPNLPQFPQAQPLQMPQFGASLNPMQRRFGGGY